jgi:hypothetical protein
MAMTALAQHNGIQVILCSILPISDYGYLKLKREQGGGSPFSEPRTAALSS